MSDCWHIACQPPDDMDPTALLMCKLLHKHAAHAQKGYAIQNPAM
jgi:hypothetical protein